MRACVYSSSIVLTSCNTVSDEMSAIVKLDALKAALIILDGETMGEALENVACYADSKGYPHWVVACSDKIYAQGESRSNTIDDSLPHEVAGPQLREALASAHRALLKQESNPAT